MAQPSLFDAVLVPPVNGRTRISRQCSQAGATSAQERIGRQCLALLTLYTQKGPQTDAEAADALGVERTSINARRRELMRRGLVQAYGTRKSKHGIENVTWGKA